MSPRHQSQIQATLDSYSPNLKKASQLKLKSLSEDNLQEIKESLLNGTSQRKLALHFQVHHETGTLSII